MQTAPLILVINLKRDIARWNSISKSLTGLGVRFECVRAVDARSKFRLIRSLIKPSFYSANLGRDLTPGECCCVLSHIAALKKFLRSPHQAAVILEDDALFSPGFSKFLLSDASTFLRRSDIVKLEGIEYSYTSKTGIKVATGMSGALIVPLKPSLGSAAYAINRMGARKLIRELAKLSDPMDHALAYYERHHISYAELRPFPVQQAPIPSNIDSERNIAPRAEQLLAQQRHMRPYTRVMRGATRLALISRIVVRSFFSSFQDSRRT